MNKYRFVYWLGLIFFITPILACAGPESAAPKPVTPELTALEPIVPKQTTETIVPVSVFDLSGIPPTATPDPAAARIADRVETFDEVELDILQSLWIGSLPPLPPDPSNAVADNPLAARLGQKLFFDTRFSANGEVSCATCHKPELMFTDGRSRSEGIGQTARSSLTIVGAAYNTWFFWDGRRDSQWAQALTPLESQVEQGGTRTQYVHIIAEDPIYRAEYEAIFGPLPDFSDRARFPDTAGPFGDSAAQAAWETMIPADRERVNQVFANIGKVIAAYERLIRPAPARFDKYVEAVLAGDEEAIQSIFSRDEVAGLRHFMANCIQCHSGPLFTDKSFVNTRIPDAAGLPHDVGRIAGIKAVLADTFNCLGDYSDSKPDDCVTLRLSDTDDTQLRGAFKVPTLRNIAATAPYMHAGQYSTLRKVLEHYNGVNLGSNYSSWSLSDREIEQVEAFLHTLSGPLTASPQQLASPTQD